VKSAVQAASPEPRDQNGARCAQDGLTSRRTSTDKSERHISFYLQQPPRGTVPTWRPDKPSARPPPARAQGAWGACQHCLSTALSSSLVHRSAHVPSSGAASQAPVPCQQTQQRGGCHRSWGSRTYSCNAGPWRCWRAQHLRALLPCARQLLRLPQAARCSLPADAAPARRPPQGWARARGCTRTPSRSSGSSASRTRARALPRSAAAAARCLRCTRVLACCGCSADTGDRWAGGSRGMTTRCSLSFQALRRAPARTQQRSAVSLTRTRQAAASIGCWDLHGDLHTPPAGLGSLRAQVSRARCMAGAAQEAKYQALPTMAEVLAVGLPPPRASRPAWAPPSISLSDVTEELDLDDEPDASAAEAGAAPGAARRSAAAVLKRAAAAFKVRARAAHRHWLSRARAAGPRPRHLLQSDRSAANWASSHMCLSVA